MEAFIVPPPQPQKFQPQKTSSYQSDHSDKNSEFGSTLDQAISDNDVVESDKQLSDLETEINAAFEDQNVSQKDEIFSSTKGLTKDIIVDEITPREDIFNTELIQTLPANPYQTKSDSLLAKSSDIKANPAVEILDNAKNIPPKDAIHQVFETTPLQKGKSIDLKNEDVNFITTKQYHQADQKVIFSTSTANISGLKNESNVQSPVEFISPQYASLNDDPILSSEKQLNVLRQGDVPRQGDVLRNPASQGRNLLFNHLSDDHSQTLTPINRVNNAVNAEEKLSLLQKNDTIGWSTKLPTDSHVIKDNPAVALGYRVEAESNTKMAPTLSTEKVMEGLTKISVNLEPQKHPQPLRAETPTLRQGIAAQFMDAKLDHQSGADSSTNQQQFSMEGETSSQPTQMVSAKGAENGDTHFSQTLTQSSSEKPAMVTDFSKPTQTPLNQQVNEENVIQQVIQRFRLSKTQLDSKLVMKLHPAELGELKLDVQLKNGTINASIVAQTRQVQEILEKNMPKLREMMEQQGLQVQDIKIEIDTDSNPDFNMFEEHLAGDEESKSRKGTRNASAQFTLDQEDDVDETQSEPESVVNLKA